MDPILKDLFISEGLKGEFYITGLYASSLHTHCTSNKTTLEMHCGSIVKIVFTDCTPTEWMNTMNESRSISIEYEEKLKYYFISKFASQGIFCFYINVDDISSLELKYNINTDKFHSNIFTYSPQELRDKVLVLTDKQINILSDDIDVKNYFISQFLENKWYICIKKDDIRCRLVVNDSISLNSKPHSIDLLRKCINDKWIISKKNKVNTPNEDNVLYSGNKISLDYNTPTLKLSVTINNPTETQLVQVRMMLNDLSK